MRTVKQVLEYLLEHDEAWPLDPKEKFLCNRVMDMELAGLIDNDLHRSAGRWIMAQLGDCVTLSEFHQKQSVRGTVYDPGWPSIRQSYLRKWIAELEREEAQAAEDEHMRVSDIIRLKP